MSEHKSHPDGIMVVADIDFDGYRRSLYMGRMLVIPRRKDYILVGERHRKISYVAWSFNDAAGEFEAHLNLED